MTKPEKPIEEPPRDIVYDERTGEYRQVPRSQLSGAEKKLGEAVYVTVESKSTSITHEITSLAVKDAWLEAGKDSDLAKWDDLHAKWTGLAKGTELKHSDDVVLQQLANGKFAMRLKVRVQNRDAWNSVEKGVSATTVINGTDPHFEYVRCGGIVLIKCMDAPYRGGNLAFEMLRVFANVGKASYGYMTKVRNKRSINHPRALVISHSADERAVQAVIDNLGSKRHVVSDLAALDDKPAVQSTAPEPEVGGAVQQEPLQPPAFEEAWTDPRWAELREKFLGYCASTLRMDREVAFLDATEGYALKGCTEDAADEVVAEYLAPDAEKKIHIPDAVADAVCWKVTEERYIQADTFAPAVVEVKEQFHKTYNQLYLNTADAIQQAAARH